MSQSAADTIFALSSGSPPAAIALIRISGPKAGVALERLAGRKPKPRHAAVATLRVPGSGEVIDRGLCLWFPGPGSATGEDLAELHLHGGRSIVTAALEALGRMEGLRGAEPGEFTRRAFDNGRIDLAEAEGLSDLLMAETDAQRRTALMLAGGALSRKVEQWQATLLTLSAGLEAALDFADEGDVEEQPPANWGDLIGEHRREVEALLRQPSIERLRDGIRLVIAGPPNAGKSTLLNSLIGRDAAITSAIPGTTRDLVEAPTAIGGIPFLLVDTAGLRDSADQVEAIGVGRARESLAAADVILWLGSPDEAVNQERTIIVQSKADLGQPMEGRADIHVSPLTGEGLDRLVALIIERGRSLIPGEGEVAVNRRHKAILSDYLVQLDRAASAEDPLIISEELRQARMLLDRITGRASVEEMLDALFGTFCIGK